MTCWFGLRGRSIPQASGLFNDLNASDNQLSSDYRRMLKEKKFSLVSFARMQSKLANESKSRYETFGAFKVSFLPHAGSISVTAIRVTHVARL